MEELARAFKNFLYRDIFYILSGTLIMLSSRKLGHLEVENLVADETALLILYIGFAYAIGMINQEFWSQFPILKTTPRKSYNSHLRAIYRRHTGREWEKGDDPHCHRLCDDPDYVRIVNVKQLGSSVGPAFLSSAIILSIAAPFRAEKLWPVIILFFALAFLFIHLTWLHNMRQTAYKIKAP